MTTFATTMARLLRGEAGRPLVTFYDHASGERTELSLTTYANWVAKTASLLAEELDLERGQTIRIDLPTHWLGPVFLGAAWTVGLVPTQDDAADAFVCGPGGCRPVGRPRRGASRCWPRRCTRSALGSRTRCRPACTTTARRCGRSRTRSCRSTRRGPTTWRWTGSPTGSCGTRPPPGVSSPTAAASSPRRTRLPHRGSPPSPSRSLRGGSLVLVAHADPGRLEATYATERATARFP